MPPPQVLWCFLPSPPSFLDMIPCQNVSDQRRLYRYAWNIRLMTESMLGDCCRFAQNKEKESEAVLSTLATFFVTKSTGTLSIVTKETWTDKSTKWFEATLKDIHSLSFACLPQKSTKKGHVKVWLRKWQFLFPWCFARLFSIFSDFSNEGWLRIQNRGEIRFGMELDELKTYN